MSKTNVLEIRCMNTRIETVLVTLDADLPIIIAQFIGAILSTHHNLNDNAYDVHSVVVSRGLFPKEPDWMGAYGQGVIEIDIDKIAEASVKADYSEMDIRFFSLYTLLACVCHEAIHSATIKQPDSEVLAVKFQDELVCTVLDTYRITMVAEELAFFTTPIKLAIEKLGMKRVYDYFRSYVYMHEKSGTVIDTWYGFLQSNDLVTNKMDSLIALPLVVAENGTVSLKATEPAVMTASASSTAPSSAPATFDTRAIDMPEPSFEAPLWIDDDDVDPEVIIIAPAGPSTVVREQVAREPEAVTEVPSPAPAPPPAPPAPDTDSANVIDMTQRAEAIATSRATEAPFEITRIELRRLFETIMFRCFQHIFTKCGWDDCGTLAAPQGVQEPVMIGDIPNKHLLVEFHALDEHGRNRVYTDIDQVIHGFVSQKANLPMYHLVFDVNGQRVTRRMFPQNPDTKDATTGELKNNSKEARKGNQMGWVINPEDGKFTYKIVNGHFTKIKPAKE